MALSATPARFKPSRKAASISRLGKQMQDSMDRQAGLEKQPARKAVSHQ